MIFFCLLTRSAFPIGYRAAKLPAHFNPNRTIYILNKPCYANWIRVLLRKFDNNGLSDRELSDYAELIKREVSELEGVERVDLYGKRSECIHISLLQDRMANLGVKPAEVLATLNGRTKQPIRDITTTATTASVSRWTISLKRWKTSGGC